ncbi:Similar to ATP synthase subunit f, mitochondrial; acc. no. Q06405 [Pyronema omphalodes CBS 100304]|uniref:Similar to ATP synthase subunit f, mitochondrial acc. no. Q06405 n=1 Tax=Pyronema omphalodes (strain CBS 100304) TaxID=1076935 RepID=U4LC77_PYROM|nr:Similar to ATP synthase subunit f, mitochondrial; acc. no. Q06405 [Pyronema omphalodes CBS 100304]
MSLVFKRAISTVIPPKVASPSIGAAKDAARMTRIVDFYSKLPRGAAPKAKPSGLIGRYQARYFGDKPSAMPLIHLLAGLIAINYAQQYYFHLRHHKNNAH